MQKPKSNQDFKAKNQSAITNAEAIPLKNIFQYIIIFCVFLSFSAEASSLSERTIRTGRHSGKKLIDVVEAYSISGKSKSSKEEIPPQAIEDAFNFFDRYSATTQSFEAIGVNAHRSKPGIQYLGGVSTRTASTIENDSFIVIFDLNLPSSLKRLHVINIENGEIESFEASHGIDSDCGSSKPGYACRFNNSVDSNATPLGFFKTGQLYNSEKHGGSVTMIGLEKKSNGFSGNDEPTTVVIHGASYVYSGHAGRSNGCVAVSESNIPWVRNNIKDGALFYFYHKSLDFPGRSPMVSGLNETSRHQTEDESEDD